MESLTAEPPKWEPNTRPTVYFRLPRSMSGRKRTPQRRVHSAGQLGISCLRCSVLVALIVVAVLFLLGFAFSHSILAAEHKNSLSAKVFVYNNLRKFEDAFLSKEKEIENFLLKRLVSHVRRPAQMHQLDLTGLMDTKDSIVGHQSSSHSGAGTNSDVAITAEHTHSADVYHTLPCKDGQILQYWKAPTQRDLEYESPYKRMGPAEKYVTFEPDVGGWNNIRMQMEVVLIFAYATGRTLVLPPEQPMYLLNLGKGNQKKHSFDDYFPFDFIRKRMEVITMTDFMQREAIAGKMRRKDGTVLYPPNNKTEFEFTKRGPFDWPGIGFMWQYLRNVSACPPWKSLFEFVVIPPEPSMNTSLLPRDRADYYRYRLGNFTGKRKAYFYDDYWIKQKNIHFISQPEIGLRLLEHFYTFIHFQSEEMDRYYKRFIRDYVHYNDLIFCKAAIIVNKLLRESANYRNDSKGVYSSFHVRRGDLQYKEVKIPADQILVNVGKFIPPNELVYIATDEKNKSFFNPMRKRFPTIRFLDDYMDVADLRKINPNYLGMIDALVCAPANIFVGTWFSTFTGYITRLRGYLGHHDYTNFYGDKKHRDRFQHDELPMFPWYMREWNVSWTNID